MCKEGPHQCGERPWERTGFKIKGLKRHIHERRGDLLSAVLTIVRAWYTNGQPKADVPTLGSFDEWAETIGSVLAFAGVDGFLGNLEQTQVVQDEDSQQWAAFFEAWWEALSDQSVVVDDLCKRLIEAGVHDKSAHAVPDVLLVHVDVHGVRAALRKARRTASLPAEGAHLQWPQAVRRWPRRPSQSAALETCGVSNPARKRKPRN